MDLHIAVQFLLAAVGIVTTIIAFYTRRHYADLDSKFEELKSEQKRMLESIHHAHLQLAKTATVEEIRKMKDDLSREINQLMREVYTRPSSKKSNDD